MRQSMLKRILIASLALTSSLASFAIVTGAWAQDRTITVASTTSTEQSGLFGFLLPRFTSASGIGVKVVAVGTGQALDLGRRGDADVVFVHDKVAEEKFLAEGFGVKRFGVMYNDFVVIGPKADPAKIAGNKDVSDALRKVAAAKAAFISRGDRSGTHEAELRLWKQAGVDLGTAKTPPWTPGGSATAGSARAREPAPDRPWRFPARSRSSWCGCSRRCCRRRR